MKRRTTRAKAAKPPGAATGLRVVVNPEGQRVGVSGARIADASRAVLRHAKVEQALIVITLLTPRQMTALNRKTFGRRGETDVISFGFHNPDGATIGDIYICPTVTAQSAQQYGTSRREEFLRVVVHGTLHVLGHDHPEGADRTASPMWALQERLLRRVMR